MSGGINEGEARMKWRQLRNIFMYLIVLWLVGFSIAHAQASPQTFIKPYPGSSIHDTWTHKFDRVSLPAGKVYFNNKTQNDVVEKTIKIEGQLTYVDYETPENRGGLEVLQNYKQGLAQAGFKVLFSCYSAECAKGGDVGYILDRNQFGDDPSQVGREQTGYLTAKLERPQGDVYATVIVDQQNAATDVLIVQAKPMQTGMVKVDAKSLFNDIDRTGHAAIYGIYFDTGKAIVKPESHLALGAIAKLLKSRPNLNLYVVGHTDNVGAYDYNMGLSRRRADAVMAVLVKHYGIAAGRLRGAGVGPLSPVLANTTPTGRAKNRRVELVAQ